MYDNDLTAQALSFCPVLPPKEQPEGLTFDADGHPQINIRADQAHLVSLRIYDIEYPFQKGTDSIWHLKYPLTDGITLVQLLIDGAEVLTPYLPITYGYSRPYNCVLLEEEDSFYRLKNVPHGTVRRNYYYSTVTGEWESCMVYTPPGYEENARQYYPVLYLQHGHGENEIGWIYSGKLNFILDNLIVNGQAAPFLVVMNNGMVQEVSEKKVQENQGNEESPKNSLGDYGDNESPKDNLDNYGDNEPPKNDMDKQENENNQRESRRIVNHVLFSDLLIKDVIPFIEKNYRVLADHEHRAMAGLSMGSMQTSVTTFSHPELFSYVGIFSGFLRDFLQGDPEMDMVCRSPSANEHLRMLDNPEKFEKDFKVFFRGIGKEDPYLPFFVEDDALLQAKGVRCIRRMYKGAHEWNVWRKCIRDFSQMLFQDQDTSMLPDVFETL